MLFWVDPHFVVPQRSQVWAKARILHKGKAELRDIEVRDLLTGLCCG